MKQLLNFSVGPLTASLVVSELGSATGSSGSSKGLGNRTDLELLKWFRSRSEIVLTSGKTAELENYRYPASAELAILSRSSRSYDSLGEDKSRVLFLDGLESYPQAIEALKEQGYSKVHCEFGPSGFNDLVSAQLVEGYVSSLNESGIAAFATLHNLSIVEVQQINGDLYVSQVIGRG